MSHNQEGFVDDYGQPVGPHGGCANATYLDQSFQSSSILGGMSKTRAGAQQQDFRYEEVKENQANASTMSKTQMSQSAYTSSNNPSDKKRPYNEISNSMSTYNTYFQQHHEQADGDDAQL